MSRSPRPRSKVAPIEDEALEALEFGSGLSAAEESQDELAEAFDILFEMTDDAVNPTLSPRPRSITIEPEAKADHDTPVSSPSHSSRRPSVQDGVYDSFRSIVDPTLDLPMDSQVTHKSIFQVCYPIKKLTTCPDIFLSSWLERESSTRFSASWSRLSRCEPRKLSTNSTPTRSRPCTTPPGTITCPSSSSWSRVVRIPMSGEMTS